MMTNRQLLMAALLAASSLGATSAVAQTASPLSPGLHFLSQGPVKAAAQSESDDTKQATVLIDEDFSGLTAGSEDQPDGKKLVNDLGDFENPSLLRPYSSELADRPWGGEGLYAAGGAIAIKDGWFLNTPAGNMAGGVTLTFRARLGAEASATEGAKALDLIFLSRKDLIDYERRHYDLTREWQTFTFTSDKGAFEATGFQFMANTETTILIDDIHVERVTKSIAAPEAFEPGDATEYGFTAEWTPTPTATEYLLSVYSKTAGEGEVKGSGDFSQVQADADGVIDAANPHYPEGWNFHWTDASRPHLSEGGPDGTRALILRDAGDYIDLPHCDQGLSATTFWIKQEADQEEVPYGSYVQLYADTDYGLYAFAWIDFAELAEEDLRAGLTYDLSPAIQMFDKVYSFRLEYFPADGDESRVLISDLRYAYPAPPTLDYRLQDEVVEARALGEDEDHVTYAVSGLDPDRDYYYNVRARNAEFTSAASAEVEVYTVSQPTVLEAADVTDSCYTARWTSHKKVDMYRVEQVQKNTLAEDTLGFEMLYEDFSLVKSEFKESDIADGFIEHGEYTGGYRAIDDLTHIAGWKASSLQWVEGWLGGMAATGQEGQIAGAISTPVIDLSNNDGECNVTVRAWGQEDDWLVIQGASPACYAGIRFPAGGFVEETVTLPCCSKKESLTFYSNNYYPFLIDYIRITQNLKAGETVSVVTASLHTPDAETQSVVMNNPNFGEGHEVAYRVTGLRYRHGDLKDIVASAPSDLMVVRGPITCVRPVLGSEVSVLPVAGGVVLTAPCEAEATVLTLSGQTILTRLCPVGTTRVALPAGMYLVRVGSETSKVVVR